MIEGEIIHIHPKLDLVTTRFSELHDLGDLGNKIQLPSYFILYHYSIYRTKINTKFNLVNIFFGIYTDFGKKNPKI